MSVVPPRLYREPASTAGQINRSPSSSALALAAMDGANNLLGYTLGGMKFACYSSYGQEAIRFRTVRHTNADYMDVILQLIDNSAETTNKDVVVTVGSGSAVTITSSSPGTGYLQAGFYHVRAPYGGSGDMEVTIVPETNVSILGCWAWDCPRISEGEALGSGDYRVEGILSTGNGRAGLSEGQVIADTGVAGPEAIVESINASWNQYYPQLLSYSCHYLITSSASYDNILDDDFILCGQNRQKTDETSFPSRWWVYSNCDSGCTYDLRISSSTDNVSVTGLTNTSAAWTGDTDLDDLDILTGSYDTLTIEARKTAGTGGVYVRAVSGVGKIA